MSTFDIAMVLYQGNSWQILKENITKPAMQPNLSVKKTFNEVLKATYSQFFKRKLGRHLLLQ